MNKLIPFYSTHFRFEGWKWSNVTDVTEGKVYKILEWSRASSGDILYTFRRDGREITSWVYTERDTEVSDYSFSINLEKILE